MTDRVAVITGGTKGIGLSFSRRMVHLGYRVIAVYRDDDASAEELATELRGDVVPIRADVSDPAQVSRLAESVLAGHGAPHVLVNNAGRNIDGPFLDMSHAAWRQVLDTNLSGPFYLAKEFAPEMLHLDQPSIVNIGSTTAIRPRLDGVNYCASKAGLLHLTKCLAMELAPTIRVNCLIPGMIDTVEMNTRFRTGEPAARAAMLAEIPQRRIGSPDEMADALEFLIGDGARYVTGQKLIVDGGQFMW
ncbi:3-oxoacyl-[acyl-carrier protein] reductase [Alloactinosynnema sp. L-07]|uniref:SDR family NAD(P)-dependent oxidoreductase n=1 Tax=Alloactinosynnema sp. L-07 TaxID=1653480 RepID=UPI00065EFEAE|nr:SDR family NAD(P)-dependent oxidoreductase [Alloactinosynnema sp. L-07]CRK56708.1 3-oxoacyl-[acyl-carrier protein] reductase [Alloactinosynnema sp. L-07]